MDKKVRRKWVEALRSGEYKQTSTTLCTPAGYNKDRLPDSSKHDRFCCLGVLCNLYIEETNKGEWVEKDVWDAYDKTVEAKEVNFKDSKGTEAATMPTMEVLDWAGLTVQQSQKLASLNDNGKRFSTIANFIENDIDWYKDWDGLF